MVVADITVQVTDIPTHSGEAGGLIPDPNRIMRSILNKIEDAESGRVNDLFRVTVPVNRYKEVFY
jgi:hypothetical protein